MIIPFDFAQVNIVYGGTGLPRGAEVTFGVDRTTGLPTALAIADAVQTAYVDTIKVHCSDQVAVEKYVVKVGPNDTGPMAELTASDVGAGNLGDVSPNIALLVKKQTALGGRHGRGRNYWPILGESVILSGGGLDPGALANLQADMNSFLAALATADLPMVLLHAAAGIDPTPVTSLSVETTIATQRRRLRK